MKTPQEEELTALLDNANARYIKAEKDLESLRYEYFQLKDQYVTVLNKLNRAQERLIDLL